MPRGDGIPFNRAPSPLLLPLQGGTLLANRLMASYKSNKPQRVGEGRETHRMCESREVKMKTALELSVVK